MRPMVLSSLQRLWTGGWGRVVSSSNMVSVPPRDVSSADLVIKNHQGIKAEIEARADRFSSCIDMGQGLLARNHYAAEEVGEVWVQPGHPHRGG